MLYSIFFFTVIQLQVKGSYEIRFFPTFFFNLYLLTDSLDPRQATSGVGCITLTNWLVSRKQNIYLCEELFLFRIHLFFSETIDLSLISLGDTHLLSASKFNRIIIFFIVVFFFSFLAAVALALFIFYIVRCTFRVLPFINIPFIKIVIITIWLNSNKDVKSFQTFLSRLRMGGPVGDELC